MNRAQSVRRTSLRDKTLTTKKDAVEETRLRLRAQEVNFQSLIEQKHLESIETAKNQQKNAMPERNISQIQSIFPFVFIAK